jgi:hypothetical protein
MKLIFSKQEIAQAVEVYWGGELLNAAENYTEGECGVFYDMETGEITAEIEITQKSLSERKAE